MFSTNCTWCSEQFTLKGGKSYDAHVIGIDHLTDIALVKIDSENF